MILQNSVFLFFMLLAYTDAESFSNNPGTVKVPHIHGTDYTVWKSIVATYQTDRNCTALSCNYFFGAPDCRVIVRNCPKVVPYDRCEITKNPGNMFYEADMSIIKRSCATFECGDTCPGSNCIPIGTTLTVEIRCWSIADTAAGNVTTTFNIKSVLNSGLTDCPLLTVENGILSSADIRHCNTVVISCIQGNKLFGESSLTCCNGTWSAAPPLCHKVCPSLSIPNGVVLYTDTVRGTLARVTCFEGFSVSEPPSTTCIDGSWNRESPACHEDCPALTILNGKATSSDTVHGTATEVICNEGYTLSGASSLACLEGRWNEKVPVCFKDCPVIRIANGKLSSDSVCHESQVNIICDEGYSLNGAPFLTCKNGVWSESPPTCIAECRNNTFGDNCSSFCGCIVTNTVTPNQSCDPASGLCRCLRSWRGERCDVDVDECKTGTHDCNLSDSYCRNLLGGFECVKIERFSSNSTNNDTEDSSQAFILPLVLTTGTVCALLIFLFAILFRRRIKEKCFSLKNSEDADIFYADLDILHDKESVSSSRTEDSGYSERSWNNPLHDYRPHVIETKNFPEPPKTEPGQEVDWENEDLTYL